ncbi:MAG: molybdenum cofactor biosynthesis protein MoaE, partial [Gemmataceae bacterium]
VFLGTVRELTGTEQTAFLEYDAYRPMAEAELARLETEVCSQFPVLKLTMVHRLGRLAVGEVSVAVVVATAHRAAAFAAGQFAIDTLKARVPIWKKDITPSGEAAWQHPSH